METEGFKIGFQDLYRETRSYRLTGLNGRKTSLINARREKRDTMFNKNRNIQGTLSPFTPVPSTTSKPSTSTIKKTKFIPKKLNMKIDPKAEELKKKRLDLLKEWKEKKLKKKLEESKNKKPIFKVCHIDSKLGLPDLENVNKTIKGKPIKPKSFAPNNYIFKAPKNLKQINLKKIESNNKINEKTTSAIPKLEANKSTAAPVKSVNKTKIAPQVKETRNTKPLKNTQTENVRSAVTRSITAKKTVAPKVVKDVKAPVLKEVPKAKIVKKVIKRSPKHKEAAMKNKIEGNKDTKTKTPKELKKLEVILTPDNLNNAFVDLTQSTDSRSRKSLRRRKSSCILCLDTPESMKENTESSTKKKTPKRRKSIKDTILSEKSSNDLNKTPNKSSKKLKSTEDDHTPTDAKKNTSVYISPFVTISRGKDSAKKEFKARKSTGGLFLDTSEGKDYSENTSTTAGAKYFENRLEKEIKRIESVCRDWEKYRDENDLQEESIDMIDVAVGQSKLLISKKFEQFRGLINECQSNNFALKPVTCEDLHGFWDMMYHQVVDLDKRFANLERLKSNNWEEVICEKKVAKKKGKSNKKKAAASSKIKDMIKRARDEKKKQEIIETELEELSTPKIATPRIVIPNSRMSLRTSILNRSVVRGMSSPVLSMMISQSIKKGNGLTPSKSILKTGVSKSETKPRKSVFFVDKIPKQLFDSDENQENDRNTLNLSGDLMLRRSKRLAKA